MVKPYHEYTRDELEIGLQEAEDAGCDKLAQWYMARLDEMDNDG